MTPPVRPAGQGQPPRQRERRIFTAEHGLAASGITLAGAAGFFAFLMVERGERQLAWAPITPYITTLSVPWHRAAAPKEPEADDDLITGSIAPDATGPAGSPGSRQTVFRASHDYRLIGVQADVALIEGPDGYISARRGTVLAELGPVLSIERRDGAWTVVTASTSLREAGK